MFNPTPPPPPVAAQHESVFELHGHTRIDPFFWLRERDNPDTIAYLNAENAFLDAVTAPTAARRDALFDELRSRILEDDESAPYPLGDFLYFSRIQKGQNYHTYLRRPRDGGPEQLVLDANALAENQAYFDLGVFEISPDGRSLAFAIDTEGDELYHLHFIDIASRKPISPTIQSVSSEGEWSADGRFFFYAREDEARRPDRLFRHSIGSNPDADALVFSESDPLFYLSLYSSQDRAFLFALSASSETTEIAALPAHDPTASFQTVFPRRKGVRYFLEHHRDRFLIRTDDNAPDFKVLSTPANAPDWQSASIVRPFRKGLRIDDVLPLQNFWVFLERSNGLDQIRVWNLTSHAEHFIPMPDAVYALSEGHNAEFATDHLRFVYSSLIRPSTVFSVDLRSLERSVLKQQTIPSGHNPDAYTLYRRLATAPDGTRVPLTIAHRKDLPLDGTAPAFLEGYGAYGHSNDPAFVNSWLSWLERGFVVAIAHPRGGGLLGEAWYRAGKFHHKPNSFSDFIACAQYLIDANLTRSDRLAIQGGSAGGLLVGAVLNQRPDLFKAAVAQVPFVDVLNTMLDPSLPLTVFEYEEWGNPQIPAFYDTLRSYSPYDNVRDADYPALLITAGLNDPRVQFWEAAKWCAKLRLHDQSPASPILLKTNMDAGHLGASGRYDYLREIAMIQDFILSALADVVQPTRITTQTPH